MIDRFNVVDERSVLRVSDHEREEVAQELREHFAAGRLTQDELSDRVQAAYRAQTHGELVALRHDLPRLPVSPKQERAELAERRAELQRRLLQHTGGALVPFVLCTFIWLATGASGQFWPVWVALAALVPLIRNGWRLYGPAPELDRVEDELARRERHEERREQRRERRHR